MPHLLPLKYHVFTSITKFTVHVVCQINLFEIFAKYYDSLSDGGVLFIGSTEQILKYKDMGYKRLDSFFYER